MSDTQRLTQDQARELGERVGIDWDAARFDVAQFRMGLDVELEHGRQDVARRTGHRATDR